MWLLHPLTTSTSGSRTLSQTLFCVMCNGDCCATIRCPFGEFPMSGHTTKASGTHNICVILALIRDTTSPNTTAVSHPPLAHCPFRFPFPTLHVLVPLPSTCTGCQEPRQGGFGKGGFCRIQCHPRANKDYTKVLGSAAHLAFRVPQPREAYMFAKTSFQKPPFFGS